ncbi:hypothetical protein JQX13_37770 [Archangium violaceum]|uniref:hypothetical protein n=1 Tax=Archangium violaceum TaxID=83451 RepID=UPI00193BC26A|nr:hypothetical protein [Archangium violaceum]QRK05846.1 hypothetical protein JQX13_37770 [Archangium violaceum]
MIRSLLLSKVVAPVVAAIVSLMSVPALAGVVWFDTTGGQRYDSGFPIWNRTDVGWAHVNRGAETLCGQHGFATGIYTGAQSGDLMGIHCLTEDVVDWFDVPGSAVRELLMWEDGRNLEQQKPFRAGAAAHDLCTHRGYGTGFFTGHQDTLNDLIGLNCIPNERVHHIQVLSYDPRFPDLAKRLNPGFAPWFTMRSAAVQVCQYFGYETGVLSSFYQNGTPTTVNLDMACFS